MVNQNPCENCEFYRAMPLYIGNILVYGLMKHCAECPTNYEILKTQFTGISGGNDNANE